ncbi:FHA domain-containing protein [Clostridium paraputrificum]|uniref:FHA domain-containing protein n=1 Tax=Clostridium paraputrificum TaxID=29363 RepID=UPI003D33394D
MNESIIRKSFEKNSLSSSEVDSIKILGKNFIFLNTDLEYINNSGELIYYISGLERVSRYVGCNDSISNKKFVKILLKICKNYLQCEMNKNLDMRKMNLSEDFIFIDPINESIRFMYLPNQMGVAAKSIDKLRLVLLKLVDIYSLNNSVSGRLIKNIKGELTYKFNDIYTLVEILNKIINSMQDKQKENKVIEKDGPFKINQKLAGVFLIIAAQLITAVLSVSLYGIGWDNPNFMLLTIIFVILIDLAVTFALANFLILPNLKRNSIEVKSDLYPSDEITLSNEEKINTSNIESDNFNIQEFSSSAFLNANDSYINNKNIVESEETTYLETVSVIGGDSDETTIISQSTLGDEIVAYLISEGTEITEKITINKEIFIIGRLRSKVDYPIQNQTVGKVHAKISYRDGKFYIQDLESKNGTLLNKSKISPLQEFQLQDGDKVTFSNSEYIFKC